MPTSGCVSIHTIEWVSANVGGVVPQELPRSNGAARLSGMLPGKTTPTRRRRLLRASGALLIQQTATGTASQARFAEKNDKTHLCKQQLFGLMHQNIQRD